jgi:phosphoheptose isomerase
MKLVSDHCAFESDCQNLKRVLNENEEQIKSFGSIVVNNIKRNIRSLFLGNRATHLMAQQVLEALMVVG